MWVCGECFELNLSGKLFCKKCGTSNNQTAASDRKSGDQIVDDEDISICSFCNEENFSSQDPCFRCRLASMKISCVKPVQREPFKAPEQLRMVLIGKTGVGKSATANTILNERIFKSICDFTSVTSKCQYAVKERFDKKILIVDTPGFLDTSMPKQTINEEIKKCVAISSPGPHAFLLVTSLTVRFTEEEAAVFEEMSAVFGEKMTKYAIVVFTGRDHMEGQSVHDHVGRCPEKLRQIIKSARGGYVTFNNRGNKEEKEKDVKDLLGRIEVMVRKNWGDHFTSAMYKEADEIMQGRIAEKIEARKEELRKEVIEELKAEMEETLRKERECFHEIHDADVQAVRKMKKELEASKVEKRKSEDSKVAKEKGKSEIECEKLLKDLIQKEIESMGKKKQLLKKAEELDEPNRSRIQKELAKFGTMITQLAAQRKDAEEIVATERLNSMVDMESKVYWNEERKMIEDPAFSTDGFTTSMRDVDSAFLKMFR